MVVAEEAKSVEVKPVVANQVVASKEAKPVVASREVKPVVANPFATKSAEANQVVANKEANQVVAKSVEANKETKPMEANSVASSPVVSNQPMEEYSIDLSQTKTPIENKVEEAKLAIYGVYQRAVEIVQAIVKKVRETCIKVYEGLFERKRMADVAV